MCKQQLTQYSRNALISLQNVRFCSKENGFVVNVFRLVSTQYYQKVTVAEEYLNELNSFGS